MAQATDTGSVVPVGLERASAEAVEPAPRPPGELVRGLVEIDGDFFVELLQYRLRFLRGELDSALQPGASSGIVHKVIQKFDVRILTCARSSVNNAVTPLARILHVGHEREECWTFSVLHA